MSRSDAALRPAAASAEPRSIARQISARWPSASSTPSSASRAARAGRRRLGLDVDERAVARPDEDLAQAAVADHDAVGRERVEDLVGEDDADRSARRCRSLGMSASPWPGGLEAGGDGVEPARLDLDRVVAQAGREVRVLGGRGRRGSRARARRSRRRTRGGRTARADRAGPRRPRRPGRAPPRRSGGPRGRSGSRRRDPGARPRPGSSRRPGRTARGP